MYRLDAVDVARGTSYVALQQVFNSGAPAITFVIIARLTTPKDMGVLAVLVLVNGLIQTILGLALPQAATKFIAETLPTGERKLAASIYYRCLWTTFILSTAFATAVFLGARTLAVMLLGEATYTAFFQVLALDVVLYALGSILNGALMGLQKFKLIATIEIFSGFIRQFLIVALIILLRSFFGLLVAWVLADLQYAVMYGWYLTRFLGRPRFNFPLRKLLSFSLPLWGSGALDFLSSAFDRALLLFFVPLATLGIYNVVATAFYVLMSFSSAIRGTLLSAFTSISSSDSKRGLTAVRVASRYASIFVAPIALLLMSTARPALVLVMGPAYEAGDAPLMILAWGFAFTLVGTVLGPMLLAMGQSLIASAIRVVSIVAGLALAVVVVPYWGIVGMAIARAASMFVGVGILVTFFSRRMNVRVDSEAIGKSLLAGTLMAAVVLVAERILYNILLLPLYVLVGAIAYLVMLRLLRVMRQEDIELVRRYLGNRFAVLANVLSKIVL